MIVLGIDPGIATTGWGIIKKDTHKIACIEYGAIFTKQDAEYSHRLNQIFNRLKNVIEKYEPDILALEQIFFAKNVKTAKRQSATINAMVAKKRIMADQGIVSVNRVRRGMTNESVKKSLKGFVPIPESLMS